MFPIDRSLLPSLSTRRALIVVDPQNDFLAEDGALPINIPRNLPERIANLATAFRKSGGDIIWVCSRFEKSRSVLDEQILTSDRAGQLRSADAARGRRRQASPQIADQPCECPEAFLTQESPKLPKCVRPGSSGIDMHPIVQEAVGPRDCSVVKSYYSAFKSEQLLKLLRMRLVTELFICGSTTNISIMATAIDAASHGYNISIVEDCCGYHNIMRHRTAIKQISNTTGCDVLSADEVLASFKPKPKPSRRPGGDRPATSPSSKHSSVRRTRGEDDSAASSALDIISSFKNLSLSPGRAADPVDVVEAPTQDSTLPVQPMVSSRMAGATPSAPPSAPPEASAPPSAPPEASAPPSAPPEASAPPSAPPEASAPPSAPPEASAPPPPPPPPCALPETAPEDPPGLRTSQSTAATAEIDADCQQPQQINEGSQKSENSYDSTLPPPTDDKEFCSSVTQDDRGIVSQRDLTLPHANKESKTTVPSAARVKNDEAPPQSRFRIHYESAELTSETNENFLNPTHTLTVFRVNIQDPSTMAYEDAPKLAESKPLCEGDTSVIYDILPSPLADNAFEKIKNEAQWEKMKHQGGEVPRLVAIQGEVGEDGSMPVYRHPMDEAPPLLPFSPTVIEVKKEVEKQLGHPVNHALIQLYRNGEDNITKHADKTIDVVKNTFIANMSLGAERTMRFRTKKQRREETDASVDSTKRESQQIALPHNSLCKMGLKTNMKWVHSINRDMRATKDKTPGQLAYNGERISLTFRSIGTFLDKENKYIWGQGATSKTREEAKPVVNGDPVLSKSLVMRFGRENQTDDFDWDDLYGEGSDVLHMSSPARLFVSSDSIVNMRIQFQLAEYGINYVRGTMPAKPNDAKTDDKKDDQDKAPVPEILPIRFIDSDISRSNASGEVAIMLYLDSTYGEKARETKQQSLSGKDLSIAYTRFQKALNLLEKYRAISDVEEFVDNLRKWEWYAKERDRTGFIAGPIITLADFAFWPILHEVVRQKPGLFGGKTHDFRGLKAYYERIKSSETGKELMIACATVVGKKPDVPNANAASSADPSSTSASAVPSNSASAIPSTSASAPTTTQQATTAQQKPHKQQRRRGRNNKK